MNPFHPEQVSTALGAPLFTTDLYVPRYREGSAGPWKVMRSGFGLDHGYCSGLWTVNDMPILLRANPQHPSGWETWMSLSPHEIESQALGCRYAYGHAAVMGLGMGWVAINMALNPRVARVTVIERDPEVIALFDHAQALAGLPDEVQAKLRIVQADALEWQPEQSVDFLYADIWRGIEEPQALDDVRRMQAHVKADAIYFWGQELLIHALAGGSPETPSHWPQLVQRCVAETIALPLLLPQDFDYPAMIAEVVRLRRSRQVPIAASHSAPQITLRPVTDADQEFLFRLYASTRAAEQALMGWDEGAWAQFLRMQFDLQRAEYAQRYRNPSFDLVCADGIPIGRHSCERGAEAIHLVELSILPEYQRRGIGSALLMRSITAGCAHGIPVTLRVQKDNPAVALYRRLGFEVAGDEGAFWFMRRPPHQTLCNLKQPGRQPD